VATSPAADESKFAASRFYIAKAYLYDRLRGALKPRQEKSGSSVV
jgi:hypothetical protein